MLERVKERFIETTQNVIRWPVEISGNFQDKNGISHKTISLINQYEKGSQHPQFRV